MKIAQGLVAGMLFALGCGAAEASNGLYIVSNDELGNIASLEADGNGNVLSVLQDYDGLSGANTLKVEIFGDLNGGALDWYSAPLTPSFQPAPGAIEQIGHDNGMRINVTGSENVFAMSQNGYGNQLTAVITGNYNQAAVLQTGNGNSLSFTQNGNGNMLSVIQRSR